MYVRVANNCITGDSVKYLGQPRDSHSFHGTTTTLTAKSPCSDGVALFFLFTHMHTLTRKVISFLYIIRARGTYGIQIYIHIYIIRSRRSRYTVVLYVYTRPCAVCCSRRGGSRALTHTRARARAPGFDNAYEITG